MKKYIKITSCILLILTLSNCSKHNIKERMAQTKSIKELSHFVEPTGGIIEFKDKSWFAIKHTGHLKKSVGLDSKGNWYESKFHFCSGLKNLQAIEMAVALYSMDGIEIKKDEGYNHYLDIKSSECLDDALKNIQKHWSFIKTDGPKSIRKK